MNFAFGKGIKVIAIVSGAALASATATAETLRVFPISLPSNAGISPDRLQVLSDGIEGMIANNTIAGSVTLVARHGEIVYLEASGYRDIETGDPMETTDFFRLASMTKPIAAVAALTLVEQGKMLLSDPVSLYLPEFSESTVAVVQDDGSYSVVPANRAITIADLLKHTSGYGYGFGGDSTTYQNADIFGWYLGGEERTIREFVTDLAELPAEAHPGEGWTYGYSTDILGAVIEVVSGETLDEYFSNAIFDPLGMTNTTFFLQETSADRLATVYTRMASGQLSAAPDGPAMDAQGSFIDGPQQLFSAGAGLVSTAQDYALFGQMLLNDGVGVNGVRVLSPHTVGLMTSPIVDRIGLWGGTGFGFSVAVSDDIAARGVLGSNGEFTWPGAYGTSFWADPEKDLLIVYMTQAVPLFSASDHERIKTLVYQSLLD